MKDASEVLFVGTVVAADNPPEPPGSHDRNAVGVQMVGVQVEDSRYTIRIEEAFSTGMLKQIDVYSGRGCCDCSFHFRVGERYLVDGWRNSTGFVRASICSKTRLFEDSDPLLTELRLIKDGKKTDALYGRLRRVQEPYGGASDPDYNQPLGGRTIALRLGTVEFQTQSETDGKYRFRDLPAGKFSVWADLPANLVLGEYLSDVPVPSVLVAADACGEYDIKAFPTGRISGQVLAQDGTGVSGWAATDIELFRADRYTEDAHGWDDAGWWNVPKDGGYFDFKHVAPGDYVLVYNPTNSIDGRHRFSRTFYPSATDVAHATRIHVNDGEWVKDVVVHVVAAGSPSR